MSILDPDRRNSLAQQVNELIAMGVTLPEGLEAAASECRSPDSARALRDLAKGIREGNTRKLIEQANVSRWIPLLSADIEAGVTVSRVTETLTAEERLERLKRSITRTLFIPLSLVTLAYFVAVFFVAYARSQEWKEILDTFQNFATSEFNAEAVSTSRPFPVSCWFLGFFLCTVWSLWIARRWKKLRWLESVFWSVPLVGKADRAIEGARVARVLAGWLSARTPLHLALRETTQSTESPTYHVWLNQAADSLESGLRMARGDSTRQTPFPAWSPVPMDHLLASDHHEAICHVWRDVADHLEFVAQERLTIARGIYPSLGYILAASTALSGILFTASDISAISSLGSPTGNFSGRQSGSISFGWIFLIPSILMMAVVTSLRRTIANSEAQWGIRRTLGLIITLAAWGLGLGFVLILLPGHYAIPASFALAAACVGLLRSRVAADLIEVQRGLQFAMERKLPLDKIAYDYGIHRDDTLGTRLLRLASLIRTGVDEKHAFRESGFTLVGLQTISLRSLARERNALAEWSNGWVAYAYLVGACLAGSVLSFLTILFTSRIFDEFDFTPREIVPWRPLLVLNVFVILIFPWLFASLWWIPILPRHLPLLRHFYHRGRARLLAQIASDLRLQRSIPNDQWEAQPHTRRKLEALRLHLSSGTPLAQALGETRLVSQSEVPWLLAAQQSGRLPEVLGFLAERIELRADRALARWWMWLRIAAQLLLGLLVLSAAIAMWGSIAELGYWIG